MRYFHIFCLILFFNICILQTAPAQSVVVKISIDGSIGPATADFITRKIQDSQKADAILIQLDTPGGLISSTRHIVKTLLNAPNPIIVYVAPQGARAASAGTFILYASTVAAMAPGTHLGAATPVGINAFKTSNSPSSKSQTAKEKKAINDTLAYLRTIGQARKRNLEFASLVITEAKTLTAQEALQSKVIDVMAKNQTQLLQKLNGKTVIQNGKTLVLNLHNPKLKIITPDWRMEFLQIISDPTIAYLLLLLGIYGIFFELFHPGFIVPGVIGGISILIGLYALQMLPISFAGLILLILGICFMVAEAFIPSFGILGIGGILAFILGSIFLMETTNPYYQIAWYAIAAFALLNLLFIFILIPKLIASRGQKSQHGLIAMIGARGITINNVNPVGQATIHGEIWAVQSEQPIAENKPVLVVAAKGLHLTVTEIKT